jgi:tripartite-type tricarboxylate transporter receptor subunit TctC
MKKILFILSFLFLNICYAKNITHSTENYASRPIRIILPQPAGGSADINARAMSETLGKFLGQNIVIDNRAGGAGIIAGEIFSKAPPDGHTMLFASGSLITNQAINKNISFDIIRDFIPVTQVAKTFGYIVLINTHVGVTNIKELVALSKKTQVNYGSGGIGNALHLGTELINIRSGAKLFHIPYKGLAPIIPALMSNEIQLTLAPPLTVIQHIKSGKLIPIAYTGAKRWNNMPDVPTMAESGVSNCVYEPGGHGIFVPIKTPMNIVNQIHAGVVATIKTPKIIEHFSKGGYTPIGSTPMEFKQYLESELKYTTEIVQTIKIETN